MKTYTYKQKSDSIKNHFKKNTVRPLTPKELVCFEPSPIACFNCTKNLCPDGTEEIIYQTDVSALFNQQRLDRMSASKIDEYLSNITNWTKSGNTSKYTPEQLSMFVKSRYCQSPSELTAYAEYLETNYEQLSTKLQKQIDEYNEAVNKANQPPQPALSSASAPSPAQ